MITKRKSSSADMTVAQEARVSISLWMLTCSFPEGGSNEKAVIAHRSD